MLIIILSVAIFTFSSLGTVKEGYKNKHKKRCNKKHKEKEECNSDGNGNDNDTEHDDMSGSYTAPAGNTVLFGIDMEESTTEHKKHKKDPLGIPSSDIPEGDEDLYILKSEVVPPVCPACPNVTVCPKNNNNKPPPPCPPCGRCPESAFECKKVPNYNRNNSNNDNDNNNNNDNDSNMNYNHKNRDYGNRDYGNKGFSNINFSNTNSSYGDFLPRPVLTDFSQFGM